MFRAWPALFPPQVELILMQPPGREGRWSDKPFHTTTDLVASATAALVPHLSLPFAFFGHSLGSLVSFEIVRQLRRGGHPQPIQLFASAHRAPQLPNPHPEIRTLPDKQFVDQICEQYGGIPAAVLENPDLVELMLPCLRADFSVFETYRYGEEPPLACPITAFGGVRDRRVSEPEVAAWRQQTVGAFRYEMFGGDHFFLQEHRDALLASVIRELTAVTAAGSPGQ